MSTKTSVLAEASSIVDGARRESYGHPRENHARTALMWSAYLGVHITPRQVCMLNILQKISRDAHRGPSDLHDLQAQQEWWESKRDNLVDIAGYARNAELVDEHEPAKSGADLLADFMRTAKVKP